MTKKTLEEVMRSLRGMEQRVEEVLQLHRTTQNQMVSAGLMLEIRHDGVSVKDSPSVGNSVSDSHNIKNIKALRSKYAAVKELFQLKTELEAMESSLKVNFRTEDPGKAIKEITRLKSSVLKGLNEAFTFLRDVAAAHMPRKLELLAKGICSAVEKSIWYKTGSLYQYVFEVNGELCFSYYLHLSSVEDEGGRVFPELFLTMTQRLGANPGFFVGLQHHFSPPSEDILMQKVSDIKSSLRAFSTLLELDSFDNTLGSLPLDVLLNPKSIVKDMFSYAASIKSVEVDEHSITFNLRSAVEEEVSTIASQLFKELNAVQRRTNAKLRMSVERGKQPKVFFKFVTTSGSPPVHPGDLEFLQLRFGVGKESLSKIARIINSGE